MKHFILIVALLISANANAGSGHGAGSWLFLPDVSSPGKTLEQFHTEAECKDYKANSAKAGTCRDWDKMVTTEELRKKEVKKELRTLYGLSNFGEPCNRKENAERKRPSPTFGCTEQWTDQQDRIHTNIYVGGDAHSWENWPLASSMKKIISRSDAVGFDIVSALEAEYSLEEVVGELVGREQNGDKWKDKAFVDFRK